MNEREQQDPYPTRAASERLLPRVDPIVHLLRRQGVWANADAGAGERLSTGSLRRHSPRLLRANALARQPYAANAFRPDFLANRDPTPLTPVKNAFEEQAAPS